MKTTQGNRNLSIPLTMLTRFARFVIGLGVYGVLASITRPFLLRIQTHYQFRDFVTDATADQIANLKIQAVIPDLVFSLVLSFIGIVAGVGLLRRRAWARKVWLCVASIWVVILIASVLLSPERVWIIFLVVRLIVLVVSGLVLCNSDVRAEFAGKHDNAKDLT